MTALASASADVDVAIIGAGVAGLAAADVLRRAGRTVEVLEAGRRTGGRAFTSQPDALGGVAFDHGAQWLHAAHRNPLIPLARAQGVAVRADTLWEERVMLFDRPGEAASLEAYEAAEARWRAAVAARLDGPDCSLAEAASAVADDPWTATIETWEGAIIAAGDADVLSLRDWSANALEGENYVAPGGLGRLVQACLGHIPVRLGVRATGLTAGANGLRIHTGQGDLRAAAAIVTVSTGVLRAESIAFSPGLPHAVLSALDGLPMGLLSKIALRARVRPGLKPGTGAFRRVPARGAPGLSMIFWPDDTDLAVGFVGGRAAWALAGKPAEAATLLRAEIAACFGTEFAGGFDEGGLMTNWGEDADFRGAYAYATPGQAGARAVLAAPLWDGRLIFAGEACAPDGLAGTVAGAYRSGAIAAQTLLAGFTPTPRSV